MKIFTLLLAMLCVSSTVALSQQPSRSGSLSPIPNRRGLLQAAAAVAAFNSLTVKPANAAGDPSVFVGTYSDPINHPGGTRTIRLLDGQKVGDYQLAEVQGGGGKGEPQNYILPAVIVGDRTIIIDFSPKGGPRDFAGVLDGKDIKFLRDGNRWPRLS